MRILNLVRWMPLGLPQLGLLHRVRAEWYLTNSVKHGMALWSGVSQPHDQSLWDAQLSLACTVQEVHGIIARLMSPMSTMTMH